MLAYIFRRLLLMIPTLVGVVTITFAVTQFVPGGPVEQVLAQLRHGSARGGEAGGGGGGYHGSQGVDPQQIAQIRKQFGFDRPPLERYLLMLKSYATFDLGQSYFAHRSVWAVIRSKLPVSITLGLWTVILTYLVSVPLGIAKAVRNGSRFDTVTSVLVLTGYAVPGFVLGVLLLMLFGGGTFWQVFPMRGLTSDNFDDLTLIGKTLDYLWHIVMPVTAAVIGNFAIVTILTKNTFLEEIGRQYVLTARAKGAPERDVLWKHVLRNAAIPLLTGLPAAFVGAFLNGNLLIETLFSLDGMGQLSYDAVIRRDYPVVLGSLFLFTLIGLLTKLIADICYVLVDPRIQFSRLDH
ncbi:MULTISPECIES: microcin C ABC transporter permease YejB [Burkholderia]|uniref:Microcin ABC transporter permease n=1 Tax=Burkholderia cenocepacia TaxID=95486 RepID=A0A071MHN8_9BURK|nr:MULTISPECIES: ABC transporter permease subunit [Burkholderia]AOJ24881.1 microcin ABC transporter permease [Burkholderia seminalis]KVF48395.1 microcin ABC transporter permease [Burkholderia seminalis]MBJ9592026.1 ABC transporter permease subunit [Burkholderia seminalis]MBN3741604.1 ABC transporter permease subunit [Burkholderia sp. Tr-20355]MCA8039207.1 ABC transporter permease subunit [Burkholderia seminalis]